jgi:hypothetical protein
MFEDEQTSNFDLEELVFLIKGISPNWVNIGADTNSVKCQDEPSKEKIIKLIEELKKLIKKNMYMYLFFFLYYLKIVLHIKQFHTLIILMVEIKKIPY